MKIGIYTDLHCSVTSSIMPMYSEDSKYTARLNMIVKTGKWLSELFKKENVDLVVNCGDTFDSFIVRAEEISAISEFFDYMSSIGKRHIIITGNHEMYDSDSNFHASKILGNIDNIEVYDSPIKLDDHISLLPYRKADKITYEMIDSLSNGILFSHVDIKGTHLRPDYIMDSGLDKDLLSDKFGIVFNGHLHTHEVLDTTNRKNNVVNIGSVSSISFSDSNVYYPSAMIYDTETSKFTMHHNPHSIIFRRIACKTIDEVIKRIRDLDKKYMYIVRATVPYDIREDARKVIQDCSNILTYRVVSDMTSYSNSGESVTEKLEVKTDMKSEFRRFLSENPDVMNYPIELYDRALNDMRED